MKKTKNMYSLILSMALIIFGIEPSLAQDKTKVSVVNFDVQGMDLKPEQLGSLIRTEMEKLGQFEVFDRYDVNYLAEKNQLSIVGCYGKTCLVEVGSVIKSDKMVTGSLEKFGDELIFTIRMIDVKSKSIEKTTVKEFIYLPDRIKMMSEIMVKLLCGIEPDKELILALSQKETYENAINNPMYTNINLSGPRIGCTLFTGETATILKSSKQSGGFGAVPLMFQFGWQFETQYLNEGPWQGLFEFVPVITGVDQNILIPSLNTLIGLRYNKAGFELAMGPSFSLVTKSEGYYDINNNWIRVPAEFNNPNNEIIETRLDSRGEPYFQSGLVIAIGKTIKSGKVNIPLNLLIIPSQSGTRFGFSFGFNSKKNKS